MFLISYQMLNVASFIYSNRFRMVMRGETRRQLITVKIIALLVLCLLPVFIYQNADNFSPHILASNTCSPVIKQVEFSVSVDGRVYPQFVPLYRKKSIDFECLQSNKRNKIILLWKKMYGMPFKELYFGHEKQMIANNCPVKNCEFTNNRTKLNHSDLVLFHIRNHIDYIPRRANQSQR